MLLQKHCHKLRSTLNIINLKVEFFTDGNDSYKKKIISTLSVIQFKLNQRRKDIFTCRFVVFSDARGIGKVAVNQEVLERILREIKNLNPQPKFIIVPEI